MPESVGGLIFIPKMVPLPSMLRNLLETTGADQFEQGTGPMRLHSLEPFFDELLQKGPSQWGTYSFSAHTMAGYYPTFSLHTQDDVYYCLWVTIYSTRVFLHEERDPASQTLFAEQWAKLCDAIGARYGFFALHYISTLEEYTYPHDRELLIANDIDELVRLGKWIQYVCPEDAKRWNEENFAAWREGGYPASVSEKITRLPSGALVFWKGLSTWGDRDVGRHIAWILQRMQEHMDIPNVPEIVAWLQREHDEHLPDLERRARSRKPKDAILDREGSHRLATEFHDLHLQVDRVRSLWACAVRQPDLIAINQRMTVLDETGETLTIPIVCEGGRKWIVVSGHDPHAIKDTTWTGQDSDDVMLDHVRRLIAIASKPPHDSQPPSVSLFCWNGISDAIRGEVEALGAQIEIAPISVPIIE